MRDTDSEPDNSLPIHPSIHPSIHPLLRARAMPPPPLAMSRRQAELEIQQLGYHVKRC